MEHEIQIPLRKSLCMLPVVRLPYTKRKVLIDFLSLQHRRFAIILYYVAAFTIKLAILLEFLRIFSPGRNHNTFWIYHILIWLNFFFYGTFFFLIIFACQPIKKFWEPWIGGRCLNFKRLYIYTACINSVSDLSLLIASQRVIWNLQMSFKRRIAVSAIFFAGLL